MYVLSTKEILYKEIENASPQALEEVLAYLQWLNSKAAANPTGIEKMANYIGVLSDGDAAELRNIIGSEFEKIEGEWK